MEQLGDESGVTNSLNRGPPSAPPRYEDREEASDGSEHPPHAVQAVLSESWVGAVVPRTPSRWTLPPVWEFHCSTVTSPRGAGLGAAPSGRLESADSQAPPQTLRTRISGAGARRSGFSQCSQRVLRKEVPHRGFGTSPRAKMHQFCNSRFSVSKRLQLHNSKNP